MFHILHRHEQRKGAIADVAFEGQPYDAGVSFSLATWSREKVRGCTSIPIAKRALSTPAVSP